MRRTGDRNFVDKVEQVIAVAASFSPHTGMGMSAPGPPAPGSCHLDPRSFEVADHSPKAKIELAEIEKLCAMLATDKEIASVFGFNTNTVDGRRKVQRSAT